MTTVEQSLAREVVAVGDGLRERGRDVVAGRAGGGRDERIDAR
jgi:hypothetical protein